MAPPLSLLPPVSPSHPHPPSPPAPLSRPPSQSSSSCLATAETSFASWPSAQPREASDDEVKAKTKAREASLPTHILSPAISACLDLLRSCRSGRLPPPSTVSDCVGGRRLRERVSARLSVAEFGQFTRLLGLGPPQASPLPGAASLERHGDKDIADLAAWAQDKARIYYDPASETLSIRMPNSALHESFAAELGRHILAHAQRVGDQQTPPLPKLASYASTTLYLNAGFTRTPDFSLGTPDQDCPAFVFEVGFASPLSDKNAKGYIRHSNAHITTVLRANITYHPPHERRQTALRTAKIALSLFRVVEEETGWRPKQVWDAVIDPQDDAHHASAFIPLSLSDFHVHKNRPADAVSLPFTEVIQCFQTALSHQEKLDELQLRPLERLGEKRALSETSEDGDDDEDEEAASSDGEKRPGPDDDPAYIPPVGSLKADKQEREHIGRTGSKRAGVKKAKYT